MNPRIVVAALSLSAAAFVGLAVHEGYTDDAVIPVKGDRPTNGFGSTFNADGTPVKMGDTTTPVAALQRSLIHIQKDEAGLKRCVTAPLHQAEYDLLVDHAYQYGVGTTCRSSMVKLANAKHYIAACDAYKEYRIVNKGRPDEYDCSTTINGKPNRRCWGVWTRSVARYDKCMAAQ